MAFRKIFLFVNPDLSAPVSSDSPSTQIGLISKLPVYYFGETVIFCISLVDSQGNAVPYLNSDTFEMSVDNNFLHNDDLMAHTEGKADGTDNKVNVPGDWSEVSAANGKFSVRVDFNTVSYETKIGGSEYIQVRTEIKKFDSGSEDPAILMQSISTARNVVNGGEGEPEEADPNYLTAAQTRALAAAEAGNKWKTGSGSPAYSSEKEGDLYLDTATGDVYQVESATYVLVDNILGPEGSMPVISGGSATALSPGSDPTVDVVSSGSGMYSINFGIPAASDGITPVLSGGSVTTLPAGASATAELVSSGGSTYILNLGIPQGPNGSLTMPIQPYSSDSAYSSMTCIAYNGGGYQVISGTTAGENPDNAASKFICFASKGTDGTDGSNGSNGSNGSDGISPTLTVSETASGVQLITSDAQGTSSAFVSNGTDGTDGVSPVVSATQTSSGVIIYTSDALGSATVEVLNGSDGVLASSYQVVSALVSGAVVFPDTMPPPVYVKTDLGTMYPVEKNSLVSSGGSWTIDPAPYLAYDGVSSFTSPWTVYFAGGDKGDKGDKGDMPVLSGGSVNTLPAGSSASAEIVSSGSAYTLNLGIPAGSSGVSPVVSVTQTSSGAIVYTSDYSGSASAAILNGTNGISPMCSVTQVSSGAVIVTSDTAGVSSATILHGRLEGASEVVSSLTSGAIVLESEAVPVYVRTSAGTLYPVEKGTISISSGSWYIDPAAYLAYDGVSSFAGPWTVYYAGGLPDFQYIHGGSSSIVPLEHQVYQISISSGASVTVDSSGLNSSVCMTAELWLDMPSSAVSFTLPAFTWIDGGAPLFSSGSTRYAITIRWNGSKFLANLAYTEALA